MANGGVKFNSPILPENTEFVILSFEGPDRYSQAGGLGVRVSQLSRALAHGGYKTHLFFVGDPKKEHIEINSNQKLILCRWCQWISLYHPGGVYQGEEGKLSEWNNSLPAYLIDNIIKPASLSGKMVVILSEEWHTASTMILLYDLLNQKNLLYNVLIFWNANNTYSFQRINWSTLNSIATITTVSRYMKHHMWNLGVNPLVIPNGIPSDWLIEQKEEHIKGIYKIFDDRIILSKVGRFTPDKRWIMAVDAVYDLKKRGYKPVFLIRGGIEPYKWEVLGRIRALGLSLAEININEPTLEKFYAALEKERDADVIELNFFIPEDMMRIIYGASDAVLANSGHEPFGLVGLEVMACGGIAFTGSTGEDYSISFHNAISLETDNAMEISTYLVELLKNENLIAKLRRNAKKTAKMFRWESVIEDLFRKIMFIKSHSA